MKRKYALYPLAMSLCALVCFVVVFIVFTVGVVQPLWGRTMLLILPALVLGAVAFLAQKGKLGVMVTIISTTVLTVVLLLLSVYYMVHLFVWMATTTTTDVSYYSRAYRLLDDRDGIAGAFPASIPDDAENVSFTYCPPFLQGSEVFELSYTTTPEKLTQWKRLLEKEAEWIGTDEEWERDKDQSCDGDGIVYQMYLDDDYHGELCYVLIDEEKGRINFRYSND